MELLIRVKNNPSSNRRQHTSRFHRGDVIAAKPNSHVWSRRERRNPNWRIIRISITRVEIEALLSAEIDILGIKDFIWKRQRKIDIRNLPERVRLQMRDSETTEKDRTRIDFTATERDVFRTAEIMKGNAA